MRYTSRVFSERARHHLPGAAECVSRRATFGASSVKASGRALQSSAPWRSSWSSSWQGQCEHGPGTPHGSRILGVRSPGRDDPPWSAGAGPAGRHRLLRPRRATGPLVRCGGQGRRRRLRPDACRRRHQRGRTAGGRLGADQDLGIGAAAQDDSAAWAELNLPPPRIDRGRGGPDGAVGLRPQHVRPAEWLHHGLVRPRPLGHGAVGRPGAHLRGWRGAADGRGHLLLSLWAHPATSSRSPTRPRRSTTRRSTPCRVRPGRPNGAVPCRAAWRGSNVRPGRICLPRTPDSSSEADRPALAAPGGRGSRDLRRTACARTATRRDRGAHRARQGGRSPRPAGR